MSQGGLRRRWRDWREGRPTRHDAEEAAFLDAADSIAKAPPPRMPVQVVPLTGLLLVTAVVVTTVVRVDEIAEAPGKIQVIGDVRHIRPAVGGTVAELAVGAGDEVGEGDLLLALDAVGVEAEIASLEGALRNAMLDAAMAVLTGRIADDLDAGVPVLAGLPDLEGMDAGILEDRQRALAAKHSEMVASLERTEAEARALGLSAENQRAQAESVSAQIEALKKRVEVQVGGIILEIERHVEGLRLALEEVRRNEVLLERGVVSQSGLDVARQAELDARGLLDDARTRLGVVRAEADREVERLMGVRAAHLDQAAGSEARAEALESAYALELAGVRSLAAEALLEANRLAEATEQELVKARKLRDDHFVRSPVDGTIEELVVSEGSVVQPAQPLMKVVPGGARLYAKVRIANKDIGHVREGMEVAVKIEAIPHLRHGFVEGVVEHIPADATDDEILGPVFVARIRLLQDHLVVEGRKVGLVSGMNVTAEIRVGKRRAIEVLVDPLLGHADEAFDEP